MQIIKAQYPEKAKAPPHKKRCIENTALFMFVRFLYYSLGLRCIISLLPGPFDTSVIGKPMSFSISST